MQAILITMFGVAYMLVMSLAQQYYISDEEAEDQNEAAKLCTLAEPEIEFSSSGNSLNLRMILTDVREGQELWLGYVQPYVNLVYEGCSALGDIQYNKSADVTAEPGQCAAFCGGSYIHIGISVYTCYCITTFKKQGKKLLNEDCIQSCSSPGHLCGGSGDVVSIYTIVNAPINNPPLSGRCLAFSPDNDIQWDTCSEDNRWACQNETFVESRNTYNDWIVIMRSCIGQKYLPIKDPSLASSNLNGTKTHWSAIIRSETIKGVSERPEQPWLATGYAIYKNGKFGLGFQTRQSRKALCVTESTTISPLISSTAAGNVTQMVTTADLESTIKADTELLIVILSICVPVVFLFVAVIIAVIICKKRKRKMPENDEKANSVNVENNSERQIDQHTKDNHNYYVLDRTSSDYATAKDEACESGSGYYSTAKTVSRGYPNVIDEDEDTAYDHAKTKINPTKHGIDGNMYNLPDKDHTDIYDKTNDTSKSEQSQVNVGVYNTLERSRKDLYDVTNKKSMQSEVDDNVYNKLNSEEEEAVYNVTNKTVDKKTVTDNAYSIFEDAADTYDTSNKKQVTADSTYDRAITDQGSDTQTGGNIPEKSGQLDSNDYTYSTVVRN